MGARASRCFFGSGGAAESEPLQQAQVGPKADNVPPRVQAQEPRIPVNAQASPPESARTEPEPERELSGGKSPRVPASSVKKAGAPMDAGAAAATASTATPAQPAAAPASDAASAPAAPAAPAAEERRVDPVDGCAYTFDEVASHYKGTYNAKQIQAYWDKDCKPIQAGVLKAKAAFKRSQGKKKSRS